MGNLLLIRLKLRKHRKLKSLNAYAAEANTMAPNGELAKRLEDIDIYENRVLRHKDPSVQEALRAYYIARLASHGELDGLIPGLNITPK